MELPTTNVAATRSALESSLGSVQGSRCQVTAPAPVSLAGFDLSQIPTPERVRISPHFGLISNISGSSRSLFQTSPATDGADQTPALKAGPSEVLYQASTGNVEGITEILRDNSKGEFHAQFSPCFRGKTTFTAEDGFDISSVIQPLNASFSERKWADNAVRYVANFLAQQMPSRWALFTSARGFHYLLAAGQVKPGQEVKGSGKARRNKGPEWYIGYKCEWDGCTTRFADGGFFDWSLEAHRPVGVRNELHVWDSWDPALNLPPRFEEFKLSSCCSHKYNPVTQQCESGGTCRGPDRKDFQKGLSVTVGGPQLQNEKLRQRSPIELVYNNRSTCGPTAAAARTMAQEHAKKQDVPGCCTSDKLEFLKRQSIESDKASLTQSQQANRKFYGGVRRISTTPLNVTLLTEATSILFHTLGRLPNGVNLDYTGNMVEDWVDTDPETGNEKRTKTTIATVCIANPYAGNQSLRNFNRPPIALARLVTSDQSAGSLRDLLQDLRRAEILACGTNLLSGVFRIDCSDMEAKVILEVFNLETLEGYNTRRIREEFSGKQRPKDKWDVEECYSHAQHARKRHAFYGLKAAPGSALSKALWATSLVRGGELLSLPSTFSNYVQWSKVSFLLRSS